MKSICCMTTEGAGERQSESGDTGGGKGTFAVGLALWHSMPVMNNFATQGLFIKIKRKAKKMSLRQQTLWWLLKSRNVQLCCNEKGQMHWHSVAVLINRLSQLSYQPRTDLSHPNLVTKSSPLLSHKLLYPLLWQSLICIFEGERPLWLWL